MPEISSKLEPYEDQEVEEDPLEDSSDSWQFGGGNFAKFWKVFHPKRYKFEIKQPEDPIVFDEK